MAGTSDISFVQSQFDELVARRGKLVNWQAAYQCSCWTIQQGGSGGPTWDCKACGGTGFLYQSAVTARVVVQGIDTHRNFLPAGTWQAGDVVASIPNLAQVQTPGPTGTVITWAPHPMWRIGMDDLVYLTDSEQRSSWTLIKGEPLNKWAADTLPHPAGAIVEVLSVLSSDPVSGDVTTYTVGDDFTVNGNQIVWNPSGTNAQNLADGTQYSVTYTHYTTYTVYMDVPQPRDQDGQHMPRKVMLRLKGVGEQ